MTNTDESAFAQARAKDAEKWQNLLAPLRPAWRFSDFSVKDGVFPGDITEFDGVLITGSPAGVLDDLPWVADLLALIRVAYEAQIPIFGACFGHQAIALALGGHVAKREGGLLMGMVAASRSDGQIMHLHAAHEDEVTTLPTGATRIATAPSCGIAGFAIGAHVMTTQYHPEITPEFMDDLLVEYAAKIGPEATTNARASLNATAANDLFADKIVAFFENAPA